MYQILTWLDYGMRVEVGVKVMTKFTCQVCTKFGVRIVGRRNFSDKWIQGAHSVQIDHEKSDQHDHTLNLFKREQAKEQSASIVSYASIAKSLTSMDEDDQRRLKVIFDIAYFVATEQLSNYM